MTDTATFAALLEKKKDLEEQIKTEAKEVFANASKDIFDKYGDKVGIFGWQQYTPYFNDGEPCEFGSGETFIYTPKEVEDCEVSYCESEGAYGWSGNDPEAFENERTGKITKYQPYSSEDTFVKVPNPDYDPSLTEPKKAVSELVGLLDEDTRLALFGDHVIVIVKPTGVETEYCEHE